MKELKDMTGKIIAIGDVIAYGMRVGNFGDLRIGRVVNFGVRKNADYEWIDGKCVHFDAKTLKVKWFERFSPGWSTNRVVTITTTANALILPPDWVKEEEE